MTSFKDYEPAALRIPIRGPFGQLVASTFGDVRDEEIELLRAALLARIPSRCPVDALGVVGQGLSIERYAADTDESYRARIDDPFDVWSKAGSPGGVIDQLVAFGLPDVRIYMNFVGHFSDGDWYSRFDLHLGPNYGGLGWLPMTMPFTLGTGTLGSTATREQVKTVKRILHKWRSSHSYPVRVVLRWPLTTLLGVTPTGPLSMPFKPGGGHESARWPVGKLFGEQNFTNMPFQMGGFII